jgi:two-component system phosphate regulon sensor histidine kinase PhoR
MQIAFLAAVLVLAALLAAALFALIQTRRQQKRTVELQSDFVAAVSHEFRTPLTTIRHLTEMLMQDRLPSPEMRRKCLEHIERETMRLNALVEDLLDFGRIQTNRKVFQREQADLAGVVRRTVDEFLQSPDSKTHVFELDLYDQPVEGLFDVGALKRALRNLIENAVKYSPPGSTVSIRFHVTPEQAVITVRDQGQGIPPDEQQAIFEKFVRGQAARSGRTKGTGIGLALVKSIAEAHGGRVTVESAPGQGSAFSLTLPLERN